MRAGLCFNMQKGVDECSNVLIWMQQTTEV